MGMLRNLAHMIFGFLLLTTLWVTALSFLSMRPASTAVITDLGVDALNPFLVSKGIGISPTTYTHLQQLAGQFPDKALPISFIKAPITGNELKGLSYDQATLLVYSKVANAYYDGGPSAVFNLPAPIASAVQTFALFPEQYDAAVKSQPLPSWLQPFLLYTGLSPETLTASGHARITALLPKFWTAALLLAGILVLLNLLSRKNPVQSLGLAIWHGTWPTVAFFAVLWLIGHIYPDRVQPVAAAFGVVAGAFLPIYVVAAAVGIGAWLVSKFASGLFKAAAKESAAPKPAPVGARRLRGGYTTHPDDTPAYVPGVRAPANTPPRTGPYQPGQPGPAPYQPGPQQGAEWSPAARQTWEQAGQPGWGGASAGQDPRPQTWNAPRPWDAPDPNAPPQGDQGWGNYRPSGPDDPTAPRW
ncbi:MAG: hypothetical protein ACHQ1E_06530 [Ktedonobacterales bacterium]|jgi:hypothetical protein